MSNKYSVEISPDVCRVSRGRKDVRPAFTQLGKLVLPSPTFQPAMSLEEAILHPIDDDIPSSASQPYEEEYRRAWANILRRYYGDRGPVQVNEHIGYKSAYLRNVKNDKSAYATTEVNLAYAQAKQEIIRQKVAKATEQESRIIARLPNRTQTQSPIPYPASSRPSDQESVSTPSLGSPRTQHSDRPKRGKKAKKGNEGDLILDIAIRQLYLKGSIPDKTPFTTSFPCIIEVKNNNYSSAWTEGHIQTVFYALFGVTEFHTQHAICIVGTRYRLYRVIDKKTIFVDYKYGTDEGGDAVSQTLAQHIADGKDASSYWSVPIPDEDGLQPLQDLETFLHTIGDNAWSHLSSSQTPTIPSSARSQSGLKRAWHGEGAAGIAAKRVATTELSYHRSSAERDEWRVNEDQGSLDPDEQVRSHTDAIAAKDDTAADPASVSVDFPMQESCSQPADMETSMESVVNTLRSVIQERERIVEELTSDAEKKHWPVGNIEDDESSDEGEEEEELERKHSRDEILAMACVIQKIGVRIVTAR